MFMLLPKGKKWRKSTKIIW